MTDKTAGIFKNITWINRIGDIPVISYLKQGILVQTERAQNQTFKKCLKY